MTIDLVSNILSIIVKITSPINHLMNLELTKKELLSPLKTVASVIEDRRAGMTVLGNILLQADGKQLNLTGGDGDIEVTCNLPIETSATFAITVPKKLLDITRSVNDGGDLHISDKDDKLIIKSGKSRFTLATLPADNYPASPVLEVKKQLTLPQSELKSLIRQCAFCIASNDIRYYLNGALLEINDGEAYMVATDGHRMAVTPLELLVSPVATVPTKKTKKSAATEATDSDNAEIIIPRKAIYELLKLLGDDGDVQISYTDSHVQFILGDSLRLTSKLIDGQFPDWRSVIPANATNIARVSKADLYSAIGRVTLLSNEKYKGVRLTLSKNLLTVNAKNPNQEEATEELEVIYEGEPLEIGFNGAYLLESIAAVNTADVQLAFTDSNSSVVITQNGDESVGKWIIMPMRL